MWLRLILAFAALGGCERDYEDILALEPDLTHGEILYGSNCAPCHGDDGLGGTGPSLFERLPNLTGPQIMQTIGEGVGDMPGFGEEFSDQDLRDVHGFITIEFQD
jgi:mono/diheme cytochrome c family protein